MRRHLLLAAAAVLVAATAACSESRAEDGGPAVNRNYQVGGFTGVEVAGPFNVTIATGKTVSVSARGPEKLLAMTVVEVKGDKLFIRPERKGWFGGMRWGSSEPATFNITVPELRSAAVAGSGDITVDKISGNDFRGEIAGSGDLRLGEVSVKELKLAIAGSGGIEAAGRSDQARYEIAGSGDLDASRLTAVKAKAEIAGSGNIRANVTGEAVASIAGSGNIEISGGAKCRSSKAGSGEIRCV